jgi:hypothetical protein
MQIIATPTGTRSGSKSLIVEGSVRIAMRWNEFASVSELGRRPVGGYPLVVLATRVGS